MKKIMLILVFIGLIILVYGKFTFDRKIEAQNNQSQVNLEEHRKQQENERVEYIKTLNPENGDVSFVDFLEYRLLSNGEAKISILGSSVAKGSGASDYSLSWAGRLTTSLREIRDNNKTVEVINNGQSGYSTKSIVDSELYEEVIKDKPDLVIFETSLLNDHGSSIPIESTKQYIKQIVEELKRQMPETEILLTSPNPSSLKVQEVNKLGLLYEDYLKATKDYILGNGWNYVDVYGEMNKHIKENQIKLDDILADKLHPNDKGYKIWSDVLYNYMENEKVL